MSKFILLTGYKGQPVVVNVAEICSVENDSPPTSKTPDVVTITLSNGVEFTVRETFQEVCSELKVQPVGWSS